MPEFGDRRKVIEAAALALIAARRRVAELDPGALASFKGWLKTFALEARQWLAEAPVSAKGSRGA